MRGKEKIELGDEECLLLTPDGVEKVKRKKEFKDKVVAELRTSHFMVEVVSINGGHLMITPRPRG